MANAPENPMASDDLLASLDSRRVTDADHRLLVESIADYAIFLLDPGGVIMSWNRGAQKMKGYEASEVVGRHIAVFYPQELLDRHWPDHALKMARETGIFEDEGWRLLVKGVRDYAIFIARPQRPCRQLECRRPKDQGLCRDENHRQALLGVLPARGRAGLAGRGAADCAAGRALRG